MTDGEYNVGDRLTRWTGLRLLLWILLAAWYFQDGLSHPNHTGGAPDWTYFTSHHTSAWKTWTEYGEFPAWNPYACGGIPAVGNAQDNVLSPAFLLTLVFGLGPGLKLGWLLLFIVGLEGTYRYARHKRALGFGAVAAAVVFCFNSRFAYLWHDGQPAMIGFILAPWVLLGFEKGMADLRWSALGGAFMAWVFVEGGAVPTPMVAVVLGLMLAFHTLVRLFRRDPEVRWYRPLLSFAVLGLVAAALSGPRLLPVAQTLIEFPRTWLQKESYSVDHILRMLFESKDPGGYSGPGTAYVGFIPAALFLGAVLLRDRIAAGLALWAVVSLALAMGDGGWFHLYDVVRKLPLLENLRCPFRYVHFVALFVALGAGRAITIAEHHVLRTLESAKRLRFFPRRFCLPTAWTVLTVAAGLAASAGLAWKAAQPVARFSRDRIGGLFNRPFALQVRQPFAQALGNRWSADVWPAADRGFLTCFEEQPFRMSAALRGDLPAEEYLADPSAGSVRRVHWSPHRIEIEVDLVRPGRIVVNQNAHRGWHVHPGRIIEHDGLLAADVPAGRYKLVLYFQDPLVEAGLALAFMTAGLILLLLVMPPAVRLWERRFAADGHDPPPDRGTDPARPASDPTTPGEATGSGPDRGTSASSGG
jgi:hypothetical protein